MMLALTVVLAAVPAAGLKGVVGADKAKALPPAAKAALAKDSFTVLQGEEAHFFSLYDRNAYEKVPSFISADVVLHVFHTRFEDELTAVEKRQALPGLRAFAMSQLARAISAWPKDGPPSPRLEALALYHAVPYVLLDQEGKAKVDPRLQVAVEEVVKKLKGEAGTVRTPVCGVPLDATLFRPRGHWDRWELHGYFRAVTWYAQCAFPLDAKGTGAAVDVVRLLDEPSSKQLEKLLALQAMVVGPPDDPGVAALKPLLPTALPALPAPVPAATLSEIAKKATALPKGQVASLRGHVFALMGGATTPDGLVLGQVASETQRMPSALHVLGFLGSAPAARLLSQAPAEAPAAAPAGSGIARRWLDVLALLVGPAPETQPPYAKTSAWEGRTLTAAAASWAELKHDTLLYVKQPMVMMQGGHDAELPASMVGGYVDPRPDVYRALLALNDELRAFEPEEKREDALGDFLRFVIEVSELELAGKPFPKAMDERLRFIGGELEHLSRTRGDDSPPQALIADVFTAAFPDRPQQVLHVGTGYVDELWVVVPRAGKRVLMRGGAFSYFEFPAKDRLTDRHWQRQLADGAAPERPLWARPVPAAKPAKRRD